MSNPEKGSAQNQTTLLRLGEFLFVHIKNNRQLYIRTDHPKSSH